MTEKFYFGSLLRNTLNMVCDFILHTVIRTFLSSLLYLDVTTFKEWTLHFTIYNDSYTIKLTHITFGTRWYFFFFFLISIIPSLCLFYPMTYMNKLSLITSFFPFVFFFIDPFTVLYHLIL